MDDSLNPSQGGRIKAGATRTLDSVFSHRYWLPVIGAIWVATLLLTLTLFIAGVPAALDQIRTVCPGDTCGLLGTSAELDASLREHGVSLDLFAGYILALEILNLGVFCGVSALLYRRGSTDPFALLGGIMLVAFGGATFSGPITVLGQRSGVWGWAVSLAAFLGSALVFVFFYLFPNGKFIPGWTRCAAIAWVCWNALGYFSPQHWAIHAEAGSGAVFPLGVVGFFMTVLATQAWRYRQFSSTLERQQAKWVVFGLSMALFGIFASVFLAPWLLDASVDPFTSAMIEVTGFTLSLMLMPLSIGVAILRYRLFDIDIVINRALVYAALTTCVAGLYILVVGYLGALVQLDSDPSEGGSGLIVSLVATGIVAIIFQPLRESLQRGVNRMLYGERDEPYAVLSRLARRLEGTIAPELVLPAIVSTVRDALKLPWVGVALKEHDAFILAAASGTPAAESLSFPLAYGNEVVGELRLAPRAPGESFSPADRRLLDDLSRQAGVAAHAVRLTLDLQRSREQLVMAREEERRRLRRDLHDGLGPVLASLTLKLDAARNLLKHDPAAADALLVDLKLQTKTAVSDIRRLVYELRPPALDDLGLVSALREGAAHFLTPGDGQGLTVSIDAPDALPPLPAAVEVAAYRIAQEALTNVVRHADARICTINIMVDEQNCWLRLEIRDDGRGMVGNQPAGVGLLSMRERASELGGTCDVISAPSNGTTVRVSLPIGSSRR